eukprot:COSAG03_NODE_1021_length_5006_cov_4.673935_6_plen_111_part_00
MLLTGTSVCSLGCATVLTPLLKSCSAELTAAGAGSLVNELGPACEKATIAADPDSVAVGTHCRYADFLPVTMVCASYLQLHRRRWRRTGRSAPPRASSRRLRSTPAARAR